MQKSFPEKSLRQVRNEITKTIQKVVVNPNPADLKRIAKAKADIASRAE